MGNVSDNDTRSPPTLDLSRFSSANGDQSSCSLEWFDAPENISTGSVTASKDEVDSVFRSLPRKIAPDPSLSLITCLDQRYEIRLKTKEEGQTGERGSSEEKVIKQMEMEEEEDEKTNENDEWNDDGEKKENFDSTGSSSTPPTSSIQLLLPSNTPDVLSDIPSAVFLDSPPPLPPLTPSSSSPPTSTSFDEEDLLTDDTTPSNPTDAEMGMIMMKKEKKKNRKKARQLTKVNQKERQIRQRLDADRIREERLRKEQQQQQELVVKGAEEKEQQEKEPSGYPTSEYRYSTSSEADAPENSEVTEVDMAVETFQVIVDGQIREVSPFVPRNRQSSSGEDPTPPPPPASSSTSSVYDIPEHPPRVVPFRDAPIVTSHPPPPPSFMPMPYNPQAPPPPIMVSSYGPPQRMIPIPRPPIPGPPIPGFPVAPPGMPVMQPMYFAPVHRPPPMVAIGPPPPQFRQIAPPMMAYPHPPPPQAPQPQAPLQQQQRPVLQANRRRPLAITAPPPPAQKPQQSKNQQSSSSGTSGPSGSQNTSRTSSKAKKMPDATKKVITYIEKNKDQQQSTSGIPPNAPTPSRSNSGSQQNSESETSNSTSSSSTTVVEEPVEKAVEPVEPVKQAKVEVEEVSEEVKEVAPQEQGPPGIPAPPGLTAPPGLPTPQTASLESHNEVLHSLVAAVLHDSDDELPIPSASSSSTVSQPRPLSPTSETQQKVINRVLEFTKELENGRDTNGIWGEKPAKPMPMPPPHDVKFSKITEDFENNVLMTTSRKSEDIVSVKPVPVEEDEKKVTFLSICKKLEPFFGECGEKWRGARIDGEQLRAIFIEAYGGQIPRDHWTILEKVCTFQPGYLNVFDAIIGNSLDWTYSFVSTPEFMQDKGTDELYTLYQSMPPVDGVDNFFKRFEQMITSDLIKVLSNRFVSVRTFVAIVEIVCDVTTCDLYYLATLVFGSRQFMAKFNARIKQIQISRNGGKIWVRQTMMDPLHPNKPSHAPAPEERTKTVGDFLTRLRPYINDLLQYLPDAVVNDVEFFKAAKLICNWIGDDEERVWKSIVKDRAKFQEFHEAYQPFLRIEIRMGAIYLRKLTYEDDYDTDGDEDPLSIISNRDADVNLISAIKSEDVNRKEKKCVSYAAEIELITPDAPSEPVGRSRSSQTDEVEMNQLWDLEREVIRLLKQDNIPFAEFIQTERAREMYQFLIDEFKKRDLQHFAFILEKTMTETREEAWMQIEELRNAAEEARIQLEMAREEHRKEFGELRSRMETISRFEAYEVQVASNSRIEGLREHINKLTQDREAMLREEVKEERARVQRQIREMKEKHAEEKRAYTAEIARLKEENARLLGGQRKLETLEGEHADLTARCETQMMKAKSMCENSSRLLLESQREIESLREAVLNTPDSQPEDMADLEVPSDVPSTSSASPVSLPSSLSSPCSSSSVPPPQSPPTVKLSRDAARELRIMEKYAAEFQPETLLKFARDLFYMYNNSKANHKERKTAEKQLKEFESAVEYTENIIKENIQMIKLNVVEGLLPIPELPQPFSETVMKKMFEYSDLEMMDNTVVEQPESQYLNIKKTAKKLADFRAADSQKWAESRKSTP
ncbi:hypothetical protein CAEBREN_21902 [Caenorhabditis brenneri]|uniref:Uncharacterized protein n=1 Tax=Caenorhabditis brenneri TaxID=135651 RepID=G0MFI5_CAEBE|nr:hypothetical protein CAEBREN_21902 [Caenorhabditis brenneri]